MVKRNVFVERARRVEEWIFDTTGTVEFPDDIVFKLSQPYAPRDGIPVRAPAMTRYCHDGVCHRCSGHDRMTGWRCDCECHVCPTCKGANPDLCSRCRGSGRYEVASR